MWEAFLEALQNPATLVSFFTALVLVGAGLEWWVWGYVHRREIARVEKECERITRNAEFWRDKALTALGLGEEISEVATTLVEETP